MLCIGPESHLDHGLSLPLVDWLRATFADRDGFFIATVEIPEGLGTVSCILHGPVMGDAPIPDAECRAVVRGTRARPSRLCDRPVRPTRTLTVIAGPSGDAPCVLYTAYGGPLAPREPWDETLPPEARAESERFWAEHALSAG